MALVVPLAYARAHAFDAEWGSIVARGAFHMEMDLSHALWALEGGYCLWVGAGLTRQIAGGHAPVPLWKDITLELETAAGIAAEGGQDFPKRLNKCFDALGSSAFRNILRKRYYTDLCQALLIQAAQQLRGGNLFPEYLRSLAALGQLANPIVSFNIEPLSTLLVARPAGAVRIVFQQPLGKPSHTWREPGDRFQRLAYHPHGLATGEPVMTSRQYEANRQSLAFALAIHASFATNLVIVGMSLDDEYLRRQIDQFRPSIGAIYWFNSNFPEHLANWANQSGITMVEVMADWADFWAHWARLPIHLETRDLASAWYLAINEATEEAEGGSLGQLERSMTSQKVAASSNFRGLAKYLADAGAEAGEPGSAARIGAQEPREIELALRTRLFEVGIQPPIIAKTYEPRWSPLGSTT